MVSVSWNGTTISGPVLIYQDEIAVSDANNDTLMCISENHAIAGWYLPTGTIVSLSAYGTNDFRQIRTEETPSVSRLLLSREGIARNDTHTNGLWTCKLNGQTSRCNAVPVGIYGKTGGESALNN